MEIEFTKSHIHDGIEYKPGDSLSISDDIALWLISNKIAKRVEPVKADKKPKGGKKKWV